VTLIRKQMAMPLRHGTMRLSRLVSSRRSPRISHNYIPQHARCHRDGSSCCRAVVPSCRCAVVRRIPNRTDTLAKLLIIQRRFEIKWHCLYVTGQWQRLVSRLCSIFPYPTARKLNLNLLCLSLTTSAHPHAQAQAQPPPGRERHGAKGPRTQSLPARFPPPPMRQRKKGKERGGGRNC
jgi:hypothetical protein